MSFDEPVEQFLPEISIYEIRAERHQSGVSGDVSADDSDADGRDGGDGNVMCLESSVL